MELKHFKSSISMSPSPVLIAPNGIETTMMHPMRLRVQVLIAPNGIETWDRKAGK